MVTAKKAISCKELLKEYEKTNKIIKTEKLNFSGVKGYDVYNITEPFKDNGNEIIAGRVEKRDCEIACVKFFKKITETEYVLYNDITLKNAQDPFVTFIDGNLVVGAIQIDLNPLDDKQIINYRTIFFKGKDIESLKLWFTGPNRMKDIRVFDYSKDKLLFFTRPQRGIYGMGKIGITFAPKDNCDYEDIINNAHIYNSHFTDKEWGGVNQIVRLNNGKIGALGHISYMDEEGVKEKHYHAMVFTVDPGNLECSPVKIIAVRKDFNKGESKREDLKDVIFPGGMVINNDGTAKLFTGISDAEAHYILIENPFKEYEV